MEIARRLEYIGVMEPSFAQPAQERRRSPRFILQQLVEVEFDREVFIPARGVDLSLHGLACRTEAPLGLYSRVSLLVQLEGPRGESLVEADGQVLRCERQLDGTYRVAIEFRNLAPVAQAKLQEWVSSRELTR